MILQILGDLVHIGLYLAVACLESLDLLTSLFEQPLQSLGLFKGGKALQLHHETAQILADLAQILVAHVAQRTLGEGGDALLRRCAVLQDLIGVADVDLLGKLVDGGLFFLCQHAVVQHHRLYHLFLLGDGGSGRCFGGQGQGGHLHSHGIIGGQGQLRHHILGHSKFFLSVVVI